MKYLNKEQVADILGIKPRTAAALMMEMNPIPICGKVRRKWVVTEENLDRFMAKKMLGLPKASRAEKGSSKKLTRR